MQVVGHYYISQHFNVFFAQYPEPLIHKIIAIADVEEWLPFKTSKSAEIGGVFIGVLKFYGHSNALFKNKHSTNAGFHGSLVLSAGLSGENPAGTQFICDIKQKPRH